MIELRNVTKEYSKGHAALNGVSVKIERGEFVFIVGDSGSGKSTLIKLIMKELNPTEGTIIVNGQNLNRMKHRNIAKYRRGLGVVFQDFRLLKDRNIYENIAFALRVTETPTRVIKKKVPAALSLVGLAQKYKSFPKELSGGEQQRVAIARAIVNEPAILLADDMDEALDFVNAFAPEHLEIITREPMNVLRSIRNAGSVFLGKFTPVAAGDYASGTNHVLPTSGYARIFSGLNVDHFTKKMTLQMITDEGLLGLEETITTLAEAEGLLAHAESVRRRLEPRE